MRNTPTTHGIPALLRLVVLAVLLAFLVPALALGDDSGTAVMTDRPAGEAQAPAGEAPAPAPADEPAPVGESAPPADEPAPAQPAPEQPVAEQPPAEEPVAEGSGAPAEEPVTAPPPSSEAPSAPAPAPAPEPEAPVGPEIVVPIPEPVLAPTLPELVPVIGGPDAVGTRPPLIAVVTPAPDALPAPRLPGVPAGPVAAVTPLIVAPAAAPGLAGALGAPVAPDLAPAAAPEKPADLVAGPTEAVQIFGGERAAGAFAAPVTPERPVAPVSTLATTEQPADPSFTVQVTAPEGSAPSGSSLLEVLAGYVLPGSSGPPASSIIFLVLLGTLLAAIYAPRPQVSERIHLLGLLGPRSGHALAVRRPG